MGLNKLLFWEKYRPKTTKGMVLLPRIEKYITEINSNFIFYGTHGTGKTTLAKIISNDFNTLTVSGKLGIDILTEKILEHITSFNLLTKEQTKLIILNEFDRSSDSLMNALKEFIEDYPSIRFIFTTNHINKIIPELKSRFICIPFDPIDQDERLFLYRKQVLYLRSIAKKEGYECSKDVKIFEHLVDRNFPDLRSSVESLQYIIKGNDDKTLLGEVVSDQNDLFKFILNGDINPIVNYDYVMNNFFITFDYAFKYLSRPFFEFLKEKHIDVIMNKGAAILKIQKEYNETLESTLDPLVHLVNYILDLKSVLKQ